MPPNTGVGASRCAVVPSPSWLLPLLPQHQAAPAAVRAHVWLELEAVMDAKVNPPDTAVGALTSTLPPVPSWPFPPAPQQSAAPAVVRPQLYEPPTVADAYDRPSVSAVGDVRVIAVPSASWPLSLFPQQYIVPAVATAQACCAPSAMLLKVWPPALTAVGERCTVPWTPSPYNPKPDEPQQYSAPAPVRPHVALSETESCVKVSPPETATGA